MTKALTDSAILKAWEVGNSQLPYEQALTILEAVHPDVSPLVLERLSIGRRDALLIAAYALLFGSRLEGVVRCPRCNDLSEVTFDVTEVQKQVSADQHDERTIDVADYRITFRLPNTLDVAGIVDPTTMSAAKEQLFTSCIVEARHHAEHTAAETLPPLIVAKVIEEMKRADPQADVELPLVCPSCGHEWRSPFDISTFFWAELTAWARSTLNIVHVLARAYGWTESEILTISPGRRQLYLEMNEV